MKRKVIILLIIVSILTITACSSQSNSGKHIEQAKLTKEEEQLMNLLNIDNRNLIYDFKVDENIKTIEINMYELKDGKWKEMTSDWMTFKEGSGRIALSFDNLLEGYRIAVQDKDGSVGSDHTTEMEAEDDSSSYGSSSLSEKTEIVYDEEMPLAIQVVSSSDSMNVYNMDSFDTPEMYDDGDYDGVYALTIMFSEKNINDLDKVK